MIVDKLVMMRLFLIVIFVDGMKQIMFKLLFILEYKDLDYLYGKLYEVSKLLVDFFIVDDFEQFDDDIIIGKNKYYYL